MTIYSNSELVGALKLLETKERQGNYIFTKLFIFDTIINLKRLSVKYGATPPQLRSIGVKFFSLWIVRIPPKFLRSISRLYFILHRPIEASARQSHIQSHFSLPHPPHIPGPLLSNRFPNCSCRSLLMSLAHRHKFSRP